MKLGADRALADLLGGSSGGWAFYRAALAAVELALERARDREAPFCSFPHGEFNRLLRDLEDALGLAATAVQVQNLVNAEPDERDGDRRAAIVDVLLERARAAKLEL